MDEQLTKLKAAMLLLERGIRFKITDAPFLLKLFRLNRITIAALRAGTIAEYSLLIYEKQLDVRVNDREYLYSEIKTVCKTIAIAVLNSPLKILLFSKLLSYLLRWRIKYTTLANIFITLVEINKAVDFTIITSWMIQQTTMLMSPRLGHKEKGS